MKIRTIVTIYCKNEDYEVKNLEELDFYNQLVFSSPLILITELFTKLFSIPLNLKGDRREN